MLETVLTATQVVLAASVSIAPAFYRRYSPYARKVDKAMNKLREEESRELTEIDGNEIELRWVEKGESGFKEIIDLIKNEGIETGEAYLPELPDEGKNWISAGDNLDASIVYRQPEYKYRSDKQLRSIL